MRAATSSIILDFDGLILDTETPIFEAWLAAYARHGQPLGLDEWQHALGTHGGFDPLGHLDALVGGTLDRETVRREVQAASASGCEGQPLLPGVLSLLREARALGLGRAVASSSSCGWVEGWLRRHAIRELVSVVVARDDVRKVKPDPELFLLAAARLGSAPSACVVFEDSPNGSARRSRGRDALRRRAERAHAHARAPSGRPCDRLAGRAIAREILADLERLGEYRPPRA